MKTALGVILIAVAVVSLQGSPLTKRLQQISPENLERLRHPKPDELKEELSGQFEGDIVLTEEQDDAILQSHKRNGHVDLDYRWPNNEIPYEIAVEHFSPAHVDYIERGLRILEQRSCLRFRPRRDDSESYIRVIGDDAGCWSRVGYVNEGMQELHLDPDPLDTGCFRIETIVHEFLHSLGFYHQQSATDRDDFVDVILDNIQDGKQHNFNVYPADVVTDFGVRYDYGSVMHYGPMSFSKNGLPTIVPKDPNAVIGQRLGMSERDISKLNLMYGCLNKN
ncbi:blastula protease 10 [Culex quinquefasciatus]|uniref:blastula protease 10 n=1 Tax=Culex quinquefasciatus TaxID=7176 RepID=UPI0018E382C2|nr:blastula protease 10 [Culex quinquefasciatus]